MSKSPLMQIYSRVDEDMKVKIYESRDALLDDLIKFGASLGNNIKARATREELAMALDEPGGLRVHHPDMYQDRGIRIRMHLIDAQPAPPALVYDLISERAGGTSLAMANTPVGAVEMLHAYGLRDADNVPANTLLVQIRFMSAGASMKLIRHNGGPIHTHTLRCIARS